VKNPSGGPVRQLPGQCGRDAWLGHRERIDGRLGMHQT